MIHILIFFSFQGVSAASIPSFSGTFVYRERTSMVTRMLLLGTFSKLLIFRMKSVEFLTYGLSSFACDYNW